VTSSQPRSLEFLVLSASRRADSLNTKLARLAAARIAQSGAKVELTTIKEFDVPAYDRDEELADGMPAGAERFIEKLRAAEALVLVSPEYNASMAGGNRGLWATRIPLEHLGARVYPEMCSLAQAHTAFDPEGRIADATLQDRFDGNLANFTQLAEAANHYPCAKKAWVEYLGKRADFADNPA
jgi:NAD(P)H-dependent FMN reductase